MSKKGLPPRRIVLAEEGDDATRDPWFLDSCILPGGRISGAHDASDIHLFV